MNKIIYLDAAATMQKPRAVIDAETDFLCNKYANAGRGICGRAAAVDDMVARARGAVAKFINAAPHQVIFTSGATDGLNRAVRMVSGHFSRVVRVAVSDLDHHSARLPWMEMAARGRGEIVVMPLNKSFDIDVSLVPAADVVVITAMSNVIGRAQDVSAIVAAARAKNPGVVTIVDAAQYVVHDAIDVAAWNADFVCFSGHKVGADTGLGVMYVKNPDKWTPDNFGGGMVNKIVGDDIVLNASPDKFEAGTLPLTQIAGIVPAIDYLQSHRPDLNLIKYMYDELSKLPRIKIITSRDAALLTFVVDGMHVLDFGAMAGVRGLCMRVGNMCATWIHRALGLQGTARLSVGAETVMDDAVRAVEIIKDIVK